MINIELGQVFKIEINENEIYLIELMLNYIQMHELTLMNPNKQEIAKNDLREKFDQIEDEIRNEK